MNTHSIPVVFQGLDQECDLKPRQPPLKTPAHSLQRQRIVHNENTVYGPSRRHCLTSGKKKSAGFVTPASFTKPQLESHRSTKYAVPNNLKHPVLSEITNYTPSIQTGTLGHASSEVSKALKKTTVIFQESTPLSARRISSTRKSSRLPWASNKAFQTPLNKGNYWDISDASIEVLSPNDGSSQEECDDLEYLPPSAIDPLYEPEFNLPEASEVGRVIMALFCQLPSLRKDEVKEKPVSLFLHDPAPLFQLDLPDLADKNIVPYNNYVPMDLGITTGCISRLPKPPSGWVHTLSANKPVFGSRIPIAASSLLNGPAKSGLHTRGASVNTTLHTCLTSKSHAHTKSLPSLCAPNQTKRNLNQSPDAPASNLATSRRPQSLRIPNDTVITLLRSPVDDTDKDYFFTY